VAVSLPHTKGVNGDAQLAGELIPKAKAGRVSQGGCMGALLGQRNEAREAQAGQIDTLTRRPTSTSRQRSSFQSCCSGELVSVGVGGDSGGGEGGAGLQNRAMRPLL